MSTDLLTASIHEALKSAILEGRFEPAQRINQGQIAKELGVSRTPVREALQSLAREGLVDLVPRRGAFVSSFGAQELFEIYDLRELLEPHAVARACLLATPTEIAAIRRLEREIESAEEVELAFALNREFHQRLCEPCRNRLLMALLETVWSQQSALRIFTYYARSAEALERTNTEHRAIVESFAAGDSAGTRELVRRHIAEAHQTLAELIVEAGADT